MLLDTCLLQHLQFVMDLLGEAFVWPDGTWAQLRRRYGPGLGEDLIALGEAIALMHPRVPPPWVVSETSLLEIERLGGPKGGALRAWWWEWAHFWEGCADDYPAVATVELASHSAPIAPGQLSLFEAPSCPLTERGAPLGPFEDAGDRALIRDALRAGVPAILTTDLRSFWSRRRSLSHLGIEVWRPRDFLVALTRHLSPPSASP